MLHSRFDALVLITIKMDRLIVTIFAYDATRLPSVATSLTRFSGSFFS